MTGPVVVCAFELPADQSIATSAAKIQADRFIGTFPRAEYFVVSFVLRDNIRLSASADNARCFRRRKSWCEGTAVRRKMWNGKSSIHGNGRTLWGSCKRTKLAAAPASF